jgi:hypothetical protein
MTLASLNWWWNGDIVDSVEGDGAEETAGEERGIFFPETPRGEGLAAGRTWGIGGEPFGPRFEGAVGVAIRVFGELLVADLSVGPKVDDVDDEGVVARFEGVGGVETEGRFPEFGQGFVVEGHFGDDLDLPEVEVEATVGLQKVRRKGEGFSVGGEAGVIVDFWGGMIGPGDEFFEGDVGGEGEGELPCAGDLKRRGERGDLDGAGGAGGGFQGIGAGLGDEGAMADVGAKERDGE